MRRVNKKTGVETISKTRFTEEIIEIAPINKFVDCHFVHCQFHGIGATFMKSHFDMFTDQVNSLVDCKPITHRCTMRMLPRQNSKEQS